MNFLFHVSCFIASFIASAATRSLATMTASFCSTAVFFFIFFDGSTWYQMQQKEFEKFFASQKREFSTGLNTQKNIFLNFFLKFLGDLVPWY